MLRYKFTGFTLIELLVTLAIVGLLLSIVAPRYLGNVKKSEEAVLQHNLIVTRDAIDKFHGDKGRYPNDLAELVSAQYLKSMPYDPVAKSNFWVTVPAVEGGVRDLHSTAAGSGKSGKAYKLW